MASKLDNVTPGEAVVGCFAMLASSVLGVVARGLVLVKLWAWFLAQPFNLPVINVGTALGLSVLVNYLTVGHASASKGAGDKGFGEIVMEMVLYALLLPLMVLFMGWVFHQFQ